MLKERLIYGPLIFSVYFVYKSILLDKHTCSHRKIFEVLPFFSIMHEWVNNTLKLIPKLTLEHVKLNPYSTVKVYLAT